MCTPMSRQRRGARLLNLRRCKRNGRLTCRLRLSRLDRTGPRRAVRLVSLHRWRSSRLARLSRSRVAARNGRPLHCGRHLRREARPRRSSISRCRNSTSRRRRPKIRKSNNNFVRQASLTFAGRYRHTAAHRSANARKRNRSTGYGVLKPPLQIHVRRQPRSQIG